MFVALCLSACASAPKSEVRFLASTPEGGVVQASTEAAADEAMRLRCPGGYEIERVEDVTVEVATARQVDRRFTYRCTPYRSATYAFLDGASRRR